MRKMFCKISATSSWASHRACNALHVLVGLDVEAADSFRDLSAEYLFVARLLAIKR